MHIVWQVFKEIIWFPIWWYSRGLLALVSYWWVWLNKVNKSLGLAVWLKNIFVPMYGQRDWASFLISLIIRLLQIIFRLAVWLLCWLLAFSVVAIWLVAPALVIYYLYILYYGQAG